MLSKFNFNHLYYFNVIAKNKTLSTASKILGVSQPTLSQQLKQLEKDLGQPLFNRSARSLQLNEHGEYLYDYTNKIFSQAEEMVSGFSYRQEISELRQFRIGITSSISRSYTSKFLQPLYSDKNTGIRVEEGELSTLIEKLHKRSLDFILTDSPSSHLLTDEISKYKIVKPKYVYVCGKDFSAEKIKVPNDLNGINYFKYTSSNHLQRDVDRFFYKESIYPRVIGESDDINIMLTATEANNCFAIVPSVAAEKAIKNNDLLKMGYFEESNSMVYALVLRDYTSEDVVKTIDKIRSFAQL